MPRDSRKTWMLVLIVAVAALASGIGTAFWVFNKDRPALATERQAAVVERGADVMGFDPDATVHRFAPTGTGGIEEVTARDARDREEIVEVRAHLRGEVDSWRRGDFSAPATIHGEDMPGLETLMFAGNTLAVDYTPLPDGARVTFASNDADVVAALHAWFEAQLSDHGADAERG